MKKRQPYALAFFLFSGQDSVAFPFPSRSFPFSSVPVVVLPCGDFCISLIVSAIS
ncbi:hypothetical protein CHCC14596_3710 [Bacillus licheniformis]|nr:hypothetical protein CHCC14596_3710 [Bacillus licheniformis]